jgi:hypothetical protein
VDAGRGDPEPLDVGAGEVGPDDDRVGAHEAEQLLAACTRQEAVLVCKLRMLLGELDGREAVGFVDELVGRALALFGQHRTREGVREVNDGVLLAFELAAKRALEREQLVLEASATQGDAEQTCAMVTLDVGYVRTLDAQERYLEATAQALRILEETA